MPTQTSSSFDIDKDNNIRYNDGYSRYNDRYNNSGRSTESDQIESPRSQRLLQNNPCPPLRRDQSLVADVNYTSVSEEDVEEFGDGLPGIQQNNFESREVREEQFLRQQPNPKIGNYNCHHPDMRTRHESVRRPSVPVARKPRAKKKGPSGQKEAPTESNIYTAVLSNFPPGPAPVFASVSASASGSDDESTPGATGEFEPSSGPVFNQGTNALLFPHNPAFTLSLGDYTMDDVNALLQKLDGASRSTFQRMVDEMKVKTEADALLNQYHD